MKEEVLSYHVGVIHKSSIIFYRDLTPLYTMNIDRRKVFLFFIDPFYLKLTTYEIYLSTQQLMRLLPRQNLFFCICLDSVLTKVVTLKKNISVGNFFPLLTLGIYLFFEKN